MSAPAAIARSSISRASAMSPPWFSPISAMTVTLPCGVATALSPLAEVDERPGGVLPVDPADPRRTHDLDLVVVLFEEIDGRLLWRAAEVAVVHHDVTAR